MIEHMADPYRKSRRPEWDDDAPTVCIAHGGFVPCRKQGEHRHTQNPYWVKSVRDYHASPIPGLTWEPAWERDRR